MITYPCWDKSEMILVKSGHSLDDNLTFIIHSEVWTLSHYLFFGHATILYAIRLATFLDMPKFNVTIISYCFTHLHYNTVITGAIASQITSLTIYSGADQRKYQSSASLAFVRGIPRWPLNSPHKGPVTREMFPLDDAIMEITTMDNGYMYFFNQIGRTWRL